jgi:DNA-binding NtrC family response regulator
VSNRAGIVGTAALEELVPLTQDTDGIAKLDAAHLAIGRAHRQWRRMWSKRTRNRRHTTTAAPAWNPANLAEPGEISEASRPTPRHSRTFAMNPVTPAGTADDRTLSSPNVEAQAGPSSLVALTLLWHPDLRRAGQQATLMPTDAPLPLNRFTPLFQSHHGGDGTPLGHACISRSPLQLRPRADGAVDLIASASRMACEIDGLPFAAGTMTLEASRIDSGVVLQLGGQVVLCLHRITTWPQRHDAMGLVGVSSAMARVRRLVEQAAGTDLPVLVLGRSGTGKELVAKAIHAASERARGPMVCVNMASMTDSLAAADLFGAARGAYTGAQGARPGLFSLATGGTLFLDEIGDTPASVQPMLLRVIETGEFRRLGSAGTERADVRLIAATDRDLTPDRFNQPLLHRLQGVVIHMPPLRQRREDIGVLALHMLRAETDAQTWPDHVPPPLLRALCLHDWPGNIRQLGQAMRRLVLGWKAGSWPTAEELLGTAPGMPVPAQTPAETVATVQAFVQPEQPQPMTRKAYRSPSTVTPAELLRALEDSDWSLRHAALALGISRPSLYNLLGRHPQVRQADTLTREEIEAALNEGVTDLAALASRLQAPREALRRRLRAFGMSLAR